MLLDLLTGIPVTLLCLLLQALLVAICLRRYARFRLVRERRVSLLRDILMLSMVMLVTLFGNFAQMVIWASLFMLLSEFRDFSTALYHSGVNFTTLGYGDIVMSGHRRLLGPLEAANGILMFGVSASVTTAAVLDVIKYNAARLRQSAPR